MLLLKFCQNKSRNRRFWNKLGKDRVDMQEMHRKDSESEKFDLNLFKLDLGVLSLFNDKFNNILCFFASYQKSDWNSQAWKIVLKTIQ